MVKVLLCSNGILNAVGWKIRKIDVERDTEGNSINITDDSIQEKYGHNKSEKLSRFMQGRSKTDQEKNTSKYIGVHWNKGHGEWVASINNYDRHLYAALAYDKKAKEIYGDKARVNFLMKAENLKKKPYYRFKNIDIHSAVWN